MIQIKNWITGKVIFEADVETFKICFELAVKENINMRGADMLYANMRGADMRGADMLGADMRCANMRGADMRDADMRGADMRGADMLGADMRGANMRGADMRDADMRGADMRGADMRGADMRGAEMRYADMRYADMRGAECVQISGFKFLLTITKTHVHIGCKRFTKKSFRKIDFSKYEDESDCFDQYPAVIAIIDAIEKYQDEKQ